MDVRKVLMGTVGCLERPGTQERIDEPRMMFQMNTGKCVRGIRAPRGLVNTGALNQDLLGECDSSGKRSASNL